MTQPLSPNDRLVLSRVFESHPVGSLSKSLIDPELPTATRTNLSPTILEELQSQEHSIITKCGGASVSAESLKEANNQLTSLIHFHPTYSSAYNNRAQVLRLLYGDDLYRDEVQTTTLWNDLCTAITLELPDQPNGKVCEFQARVLRAGYAQRGYLTWKAAKRATQRLENLDNLPEELRSLTRREMEDKARADLELAGRYGDQEAMKMAVSANPYARLCGNIVQEAMKVEIEKMRGSTEWVVKEKTY
ncbi:hypothetical protein TMatcc_008048 [Talaromyces marneffei ATCC 18224]|uniref:Uncharacterized protein n=1 Tax=Talaromyces marneffei (strain ATCC 18224 / CBS 334.59 / QM 7333) TaxID=441960 RepID=B6QEH3_TALMQ|nr:uncharacterized protein EYB26_004951 [Talaromyces marneffei]EEA24947.1 conserved hypothetical protein [Talaromyces marneffei ATCC 18224]KAE8552583.1 hypothetical protein EYB25_003961 [Talaromyces marneffei]QGA17280.1 hypothetical protein EYB26_004951 [Talaromyces marneffei]